MKFLILLIGLLVFVFFGMPDCILYAKEGIIKWIPFIIIFVGIPILLYKTLKSFNMGNQVVLAISIASVLVFGPCFGVWSGIQSDKDLERNGITTKGLVVKKWKRKKHKRNEIEWLYKAEFKYKSKKYMTFTKTDENNIINHGDIVKIKFSSRNPENNNIIE